MRRAVGFLGVAALLLAHAGSASAAEQETEASVVEGVHLEVDAPSPCVTEADLRAEVAALGSFLREPGPDERARTLTAHVALESPTAVTGRVVVRDLVGRETSRATVGASCTTVLHTLALFVALAIDEPPDAASSASEAASSTPSKPAEPTFTAPWPTPAESPAKRPSRALGGGGLLVTTGFGTNSTAEAPFDGVSAFAAWRVGVTRFGITGGVSRDKTSPDWNSTDGTTYRGGGIIGWGAPWNDSVVGYVGQLGVAGGDWTGPKSSDAGFVTGKEHKTWAGVYGSNSVVLQIPWRYSMRPVAMLTCVATANAPGYPLSARGDLGVVWQAW